jgi:replicative DNA helicase
MSMVDAQPRDAPARPQPLTPPHNLEAEQAVLGAVLISNRSLYGLVVHTGLAPEDFYREQHRAVYAAMLALYRASEPVDALTVAERLRQDGRLEEVGGAAAVQALAGPVPAAGHVHHYAQIVRGNALLRSLLDASYDIQAGVLHRDGAPRELVERAERAVLKIGEGDTRKDFRAIGDVLHAELDKLQELSRHGTSLTGTPSGFADLDEVTGGFQAGNLIVVAARPSMGKSALVTNIAENAAVTHHRAVALFSLEMSEAELAQRFVASQARVKGEELRKGRVEDRKWPTILKASQRLSAAPLYVDDSSDLGILEVRAKARRLHQQHQADGGLGLIIVDYLQLMRAEPGVQNRVEQVGLLSRGLKILASELGVPVIALSQLSRAPEQRTDHRPLLSDLRESGNIEQDADLVIFIYRDDYYDKESERPGEADLLIAKHRNGALGDVRLTFRADYPQFRSYIGEERYA